MGVYGRCLDAAVKFFGAEKAVSKIAPMHVGQYYKSDELLKKKNGTEKSPISIEQGKRVFRMMLMWATEQGYIKDLPLPKTEKSS